MKTSWHRTRRLSKASLGALAALLVFGFLLTPAADHRDGPIFGPPGVNGPGGITQSRRDINDIYVFRAPTNPLNTVLIMTISPFSTVNTPAVFDQRLTYDFNIINRDILGAITDVKLRVTFAAPDNQGRQRVVLSKFPAPQATGPNPPRGGTTTTTGDPVVASGRTGENLPIMGGGMFRAAEQDDPFFFDAAGFGAFLNGAAFPRPIGTAVNFFGQNVNTLAITIEIPSRVLKRPNSNVIGVWCSVLFQGNRIDRMGRPAINTAVIPPVPRGSNFPVDPTIPNRRERRNAFNAGHPKNDRRDFKADMVSVLQNFYGRNATDSSNIADALLPDILVFDVTSNEGFGTTIAGFVGNGRRLRDDVIDFELNLLTNGQVTTDNIPDDNPGAPTSAANPIQPTFPFIGARSNTPEGLPRQGQPAPGN